MSFSQTASLVETDNLLGIGGESGIGMGAGVPLLRGRFNALVSLVHVFDVPLEKKEVGRRLAVDLQCATIIPLDRSFNFFAVKQDNNHRRVRIDLLLVVKELGVGLHRWRRPLSHLYGRLLCRTRGFSTRVSSAVAAMPSLGTAVGTFPGLRHLARLTLDLGERGSDEFTIAHLFLYLQKIRTDSKSIARRTFGGDGGYANHSTLAGCGHLTRRRKLYQKWKALQGITLMLHKRDLKSKGQNPGRRK